MSTFLSPLLLSAAVATSQPPLRHVDAPHALLRLRGGLIPAMSLRKESIVLAFPRGQQPVLSAAVTVANAEPDYVDTALAAAGAGVGVALLTLLNARLPLKLWSAGMLQGVYVTTLCSSAIILNYGEKPPNFLTVFWATFVPAAVTVALMALIKSSALVRPISVMFTMAWFKLAGCAFPPAAALANTFLDNPTCAPMGWAYVTLPCAGNAILWAVAWVFSHLRMSVKSRGLER